MFSATSWRRTSKNHTQLWHLLVVWIKFVVHFVQIACKKIVTHQDKLRNHTPHKRDDKRRLPIYTKGKCLQRHRRRNRSWIICCLKDGASSHVTNLATPFSKLVQERLVVWHFSVKVYILSSLCGYWSKMVGRPQTVFCFSY